jgi:cysteinyl-tRNA synthetase
MLQIYNTLSRKKEDFRPIEPGKVRMYVCGMTVYDLCHVGHARMLIAFDLIQRWLRASAYEVTYVRNITDIDDKIIKRAVENGETTKALTGRFIAAMHEDLAALGVATPDHEPRATDFVPQMLNLVALLEKNGLAYKASDGDVNFAVRRFPGYGKLSGKSLEDLRAGERVTVNTGKEDPLDFVLWKASKPEEPADVKWESSYGSGRPGWHIECSAMASSLLGNTLDIHGGGADLQFPHHENEIAQSEGAMHFGTHGKFVNYWMHNGFVNIDNEKMSKSLGNFFTIREVVAKFDPEVLRFFVLRSHYRSPLNYSDVSLEDSRQGLLRLYNALSPRGSNNIAANKEGPADSAASAQSVASAQNIDWTTPSGKRFKAAMDDDFNTPVALAVLFDLVTELNRSASPAVEAELRSLAAVLNILNQDPEAVKRTGLLPPATHLEAGFDEQAIQSAIAQRIQAKKEKRFAEADAIRAELLAQGIMLEDGPAGTSWRRS